MTIHRLDKDTLRDRWFRIFSRLSNEPIVPKGLFVGVDYDVDAELKTMIHIGDKVVKASIKEEMAKHPLKHVDVKPEISTLGPFVERIAAYDRMMMDKARLDRVWPHAQCQGCTVHICSDCAIYGNRPTFKEQESMPGLISRKGDPGHEEAVALRKSERLAKEREAERQFVRGTYERPTKAHSQEVEMIIAAARLEHPQRLVEQAQKQNETTSRVRELEKVTREVEWKPKHCRRCGHANGCMCPREVEAIEEKCQHLQMDRVSSEIAKELLHNRNIVTVGVAFFACPKCRSVLSMPLGKLP